jgi:O-antigen ligase
MESVLKGRSLDGVDQIRWLLLAVPVYAYMIVGWIIRPFSYDNIALAYALPLAFVTGMLLLQVSRLELVALLRRLRLELTLGLIMGLLSILSVINSDDPIRILRILFPSVLPILLFFQLVALRSVSPETVARLPRIFLMVGVVLGCLPLFLTFASDGIHTYFFQGGYRFMGMFDHENQLSVMIAVLVPLIIGEIAIAERRLGKWLWLALLVVVFYTLVRVGSKTALIVTFGYAWLFYILAHYRFQSFLKNIFLISVVIVSMIFLGIYGIPIAKAIDPTVGAKIEAIFSGGIGNYATIVARSHLWSEAWRQGLDHWLIGAGAGEIILGNAHAHNLVLDYFRGIGVFGAIAIVLLCIRILWRAVAKSFDVLLAKTVSATDLRVLACYASAAVYVVCNQLSNSFGPATISALWLLYMAAVLTEYRADDASLLHPARTSRR